MPQRGLRAGGAVGLLAAISIAIAIASLPELPGPEAGEAEVFAFFLDDANSVSAAAAFLAAGSLLLVALFATVRARTAAAAAGPAGTTMLIAASIGAAGQAFYAATLATVTVRSEDAEPATARALLDLAETVAGVSGLAFAIALFAAGIMIRRPGSGLPTRLGDLALLAGLALGLWLARFFTTSGIFAADGLLGSTVGSLLLLIWIAATSLWFVTEELSASVPGSEN